MAVGWASDDSVSQQIQNTIDDEISRVRGNIKGAKVLTIVMNVETRYLKRVELQ